ncbi:MAG: SDR family oxidoreductase [Bryobacteraceae bacterium]|jgi:NAD(P)-dependent dehydrogenase (short-subunit alcohol dehydrogenase family)
MTNVFRERILAGRNAYITGGTSGICLGIAELFARQGARVAVQGRNPEKVQTAVQTLASYGGLVRGCPADVRDAAATGAALQSVRESWGEIDILVCGAAGNFPAPVVGISPNGFKSVVDIDLLGTFNTARLAWEHLRRPGASVLAISATHGAHPYEFQAHVCAAKAGVDMLCKVLALEWGPAGVRVNAIAPGPVDGTEGMRRLAPTDEVRAVVRAGVPLRRFASIEEIAAAALFLCSEAAAYITGTVLNVDGGTALVGSRFIGEALVKPRLVG